MAVVHQVVIFGTGTNVGKTHLTRSLVHALRAQDRRCAAVKPIETGLGAHVPDYVQLAVNTEPVAPLYGFEEALSPHAAARNASIEIDIGRCLGWVHDQSSVAEWVLVETPGGLFSPLSPAYTNFELAMALRPAAFVLVVADKLGCFHDLIACLRAAGDAMQPLYIVFTAAQPDHTTGKNAEELPTLGYEGPVWVMPRGEPSDAACRVVADSLVAAIAVAREETAEES